MSFFQDHIIKEYEGREGQEVGSAATAAGERGAKVRGGRRFVMAELLSGSVGGFGDPAATPSA